MTIVKFYTLDDLDHHDISSPPAQPPSAVSSNYRSPIGYQ